MYGYPISEIALANMSQLEKYYDLNYTIVSLVFLSPFAGYTMAAILNNTVHVKFGQRGVAIVAPACHLISFVVLAAHPPYPVLVVIFILVGFGNGLIDAAWCAWIGNMANANEVSGFLQACYSLGATVSPLMATAMFTKGGLPWYTFYYLMVSSRKEPKSATFNILQIGTSAIEIVTSSITFWKQTGAIYKLENPTDSNSDSGRTREAIKNKVTWIFAAFIFGYVGAEGIVTLLHK